MHTNPETTRCRNRSTTGGAALTPTPTTTTASCERRVSTASSVSPALTAMRRKNGYADCFPSASSSTSVNTFTVCSNVVPASSSQPWEQWKRRAMARGDRYHVIYRTERRDEDAREPDCGRGYDYQQRLGKEPRNGHTSSSLPDPKHKSGFCAKAPADGHVDGSSHWHRCDRYDMRQTSSHSPPDLTVILFLFMTSASFMSSGRLIVWGAVLASVAAVATAASQTAAAAAPDSTVTFGSPPLASRSSGLDPSLSFAGYPFASERKLSSRTVTTKYGTLTPNAAEYARQVAAFLSCPTDSKKVTQMVECLRQKSVSELLAAEAFLLTRSNGSVKLPSTTGSSALRLPVNSMFPISRSNRTKDKIQAIDSSKVVPQQQRNTSLWNENSSLSPSSSSSSATSDLRSDSNPLGISRVTISNHHNNNNDNNQRTPGYNKSKGVVGSESRNSSANQTTHSNSYTIAIYVVVIGMVFLVVNILLLLREYCKGKNSPPDPTPDAKAERSCKSQSGGGSSLFSRESSPTSNQLHIIQSHLHQRCLLRNESLDDLCSKQEAITQSHRQPESSSSPVLPHEDTDTGDQRSHEHDDREIGSPVTAALSFHPELISGHHLPQFSHSFHVPQQFAMQSSILSPDQDVSNCWRRQTVAHPHPYHQHHYHHHNHLQQRGTLPLAHGTAVNGSTTGGTSVVYGARVSTSGSSCNSDSISSVGSVLSHAHRLVHSDFCQSLPRTEGVKKVSFLNPADSLIIYGGVAAGGGSGAGSGVGDEIKSSADTPV